MKTKLLLRIAAAVATFVLVGGISVAALARSGANSSTAPLLPVVSTPQVENDATETPEPQETESPEPNETETPEADEQGEIENDQGEDPDEQNEDSDDQNENEDSDDSNDSGEDD